MLQNENSKSQTGFRSGPNYVGLRDPEQDQEKLFQKYHQTSTNSGRVPIPPPGPTSISCKPPIGEADYYAALSLQCERGQFLSPVKVPGSGLCSNSGGPSRLHSPTLFLYIHRVRAVPTYQGLMLCAV